ncbi:MAG: hypothetical protein AB7O32_09420 [Vicinamibacterales bacterium]
MTVVVEDAAGNSHSWGARVLRDGTPTWVSVTPDARTVRVGERVALAVVADTGVISSGIAWSTSDSSVVSVAADGTHVLTADAVGQATLTATVGTLSATATVTVIGSGPWPVGQPRWVVNPSTCCTQATIYAQRRSATGPDLFLVEGAFGSYTLRALRVDGTTLWTEHVPSGYDPSYGTPVGDVDGGVLLPLGETAVVRVGGEAGVLPWRYASPGTLNPALAQSPDGTIYLAESVGTPSNLVGYVVALDGRTGAVKFRTPVPLFRSREVFTGSCSNYFRPPQESFDPQIWGVDLGGRADAAYIPGHPRVR